MAGKSAVLSLKITGDAAGGKRALADMDDASGRFSKAMGFVAAGAGAALVAVGALGKAAFDSASELEQQAGAVDAVFGKNAKQMHAYSRQAARTVGLATSEYDRLASVLGAQLSNAGFAGDKLSGTVDDLVKKGSDLAAQFGGSTADAVEALSSVMKGETDPIERYGVSLKQSDINARLAAKGQDKLTGAALKNATAQAALDLITKQTTSSVGAHGREMDTAAGKMQTLSAMWEDGKAKLGQALLPVFVTFAGFVTDKVVPALETLFQKGGPVNQMFSSLAGFLRDDVLPTLSAVWAYTQANVLPVLGDLAVSVRDVVVPAVKGLWIVFRDQIIPVLRDGLVPALQKARADWAAVAKAVQDNTDKFAKFYQEIKPVAEFITKYLSPALERLPGNFSAALGPLGKLIDGLAWILDHGADAMHWINGLNAGPIHTGGGSFGAAPAFVAVAGVGGGRMFGAAGGTSSGSGGVTVAAAAPVVNITVNGALDPVAVGRQLDGLLRRYVTTVGRNGLMIGARA